MIIFMAFYLYFIIQVIMASKWKDTNLTELKNKLNSVPSIVEKWTKKVKSKISDGSVVVIEKAKNLTQKAWETIKEWKDYVVDKYNNIRTKLKSSKSTQKKGSDSKDVSIDNKSISELIEANKELIALTKKLVDKYEENIKLLEKINKNLSKKK